MKQTIESFFTKEIDEIRKNIERIEIHLDKETSNSPRYSGQRAMLAIQQEHLELMKELNKNTQTYDEVITAIERNIISNEILHSKIAFKENPTKSQHSAEWWQTLHLIQFWSEILGRIHAWHKSIQLA